jgi:hypothetical protein
MLFAIQFSLKISTIFSEFQKVFGRH